MISADLFIGKFFFAFSGLNIISFSVIESKDFVISKRRSCNETLETYSSSTISLLDNFFNISPHFFA